MDPPNSMDWGALAVFAFVYGAAFVTARHGYQAPDSLHRTYKDQQSATKVAITSDNVLPELVNLIMDVNLRASRASGATEVLLDEGVIANTLDSAGYLDRLVRLSRLYYDFAQIDALLDSAKKWARRKAIAAAVLAVALLPLPIYFGFGVSTTPFWLIASSVILSCLMAGLAGICWRQEASSRNRLSELCAGYA